MKNYTPLIIGSTVIALLILAMVIFGGSKGLTPDSSLSTASPAIPTPTSTVHNVSSVPIRVTIMVPQDIAAYRDAVGRYWSDGGIDPTKTWPFVSKTVEVVGGSDPMLVAAQAAANEISTSGGAAAAKIIYFKVQGGTAYVSLRMDVDGWAGVAYSIDLIHPLVERTLLQFPDVRAVSFRAPAPGDTMETIIQALNSARFNQ